MGNAYLAVYNGSLALGWGYCLYLIIQTVLAGGYSPEAWKAVELPLKVVQTAAVLEVLHSALRIVKSPVMVTAMQVASREFVLWGIVSPLHMETTTQGVHLITLSDARLELNFITLVVAWSISEVIRYGFFAFKELGQDLYVMKWLRYTGFIVLYPVGVASELAMIYLALPAIRSSRMWSFDMPNAYNMAFDYHIMCCISMFIYVPGFPHMYFYMLSQRKKALSPKPKAA